MKGVFHEKSMDELVLLSERDAERCALDTLNCRVLFRLLMPFALVAVVVAITLMTWRGDGTPGMPGPRTLALVPLLTLGAIRALYYFREHAFFTRWFRAILFGYLSLQLLSWRWLAEVWPSGEGPSAARMPSGAEAGFPHPLDIMMPLILMFFRFRSLELGSILGIAWLAGSGRHLIAVALGSTTLDSEHLIAHGIFLIILFLISRGWTHRRRREFLDHWRREFRRDQDRRRMQGELADARRFQLAMLPHTEPTIPGLDLSGLSIPASEVGGDYYGYFPMTETRCALVVADVSGHGVASGLLLSGVRSCLYLLQETPMEPVEVLGRLDRMLRRIAQKRAFVTMVYAIWDDEKKHLEIASAGHPPVLCFRAASGQVEEIDLPALPLGTPIAGEFQQTTVDLEPGDVFLLYTDGIGETMNALQNLYGEERLYQALSRAARDRERSAKQIRDAVLSHLWSFKADGVQHDDVTLVVGRVR